MQAIIIDYLYKGFRFFLYDTSTMFSQMDMLMTEWKKYQTSRILRIFKSLALFYLILRSFHLLKTIQVIDCSLGNIS
jgi:hypothetical protein